MTPALAQRLAEIRATCGEVRVVKEEPDRLVVLVLDGDPDPFLMVVKLDALDQQHH
jgi:hypothetical protein